MSAFNIEEISTDLSETNDTFTGETVETGLDFFGVEDCFEVEALSKDRLGLTDLSPVDFVCESLEVDGFIAGVPESPEPFFCFDVFDDVLFIGNGSLNGDLNGDLLDSGLSVNK